MSISNKIYGKRTAIIIVSLLLVLSLLAVSTWRTLTVSSIHPHIVDLSNDTRYELSIFHLWLEEYIAGDETLDKETVWSHLNQAKKLSTILVNGGEYNGESISAPKNSILRNKAQETINEINTLEKLAELRLQALLTSQAGSKTDTEFDHQFHKIQRILEQVDKEIKVFIEQDLRTFFLLNISAGLLILLFGIVLIIKFRDIFNTQEERAIRIFEDSINPMMTIDENGIIDTFNKASETLLGYRKNEIIGQHIKTLMPSFFSVKHASQLPEYKENSEQKMTSVSREVTAQHKGGTTIDIHLSIGETHVRDEIFFICTLTDISERLASEKQIKEQNTFLTIEKNKAEMATKAKDSFLATMSHEIRTPMNGVLGMTQLLMDTKLSAEQQDYAQTISSSGTALLDIINDILDFSKIEAGKLDIEPIPFDLQNAILETVDLLHNKIAEKKLELIVDYAPELHHHFIGDPGRIRQILMNLISNAIKFTKAGHVLIKVTSLSSDKEEEHLLFEVIDTGIGIDEAAQRNLFDSFTQADTSTTRKYGGTGLGLTICKQLVELMGGKISIKSQLGDGSNFQFYLSLPLSTAATEHIPVDIDFGSLRVLIVDDNQVNLTILSKQLSKWNIRSEAVISAGEVIPKLSQAVVGQDPFQLLLSDFHMPNMNGAGLMKLIKANPKIANTKAILLSSSSTQRGDAKHFSAIGFSGYLAKPIHLVVLHEMISLLWRHIQNGTEPERIISRHTVSESHADTATNIDNGAPSEILKVLLVEDSIVNQKVAKILLENNGCKVDVAANGKEGVEMQAQFPYKIVFMDCQMPVMDGFEATKAIRESEDGTDKHQVIVAMTANAIEGDRENCLQHGMDDYISKPVDKNKLLLILEQCREARL